MVQSMFADLAVRMLADAQSDPEIGFDLPLWKTVEEMGLDRLLLPEDEGGAGDVFPEAVAVLMAFGGAGAALPLADTIIANWCLSRAGLEVPEGPKAFLSAPDLTHGPSGWSGAGYWLPITGSAVFLTEAAGQVLVETRSEIAGQPGTSASGEPLIWIASDAELGKGNAVVAQIEIGHALALAATLEAAAIVGALDRICALSIEYANTRKQFGRPIGKFQAVQAMIARLASEVAAARAAVEHAATMLDSPAALFWGGIAKARASEAAGKAAAYVHQIHGAIGYTREYELHRYTRRLWTWRERRGNERYWNERIGSAATGCDDGKLWAGLVTGLKL